MSCELIPNDMTLSLAIFSLEGCLFYLFFFPLLSLLEIRFRKGILLFSLHRLKRLGLPFQRCECVTLAMKIGSHNEPNKPMGPQDHEP